MGERLVRNEEVRGSIPLSSTTAREPLVNLSHMVHRRMRARLSGYARRGNTHHAVAASSATTSRPAKPGLTSTPSNPRAAA